MLLFMFSSNMTPRIFFATTLLPTLANRLSCGEITVQASEREPEGLPVKKIALEEHFLCPGLDHYWKATVEDINPEFRDRLLARLFDFGEMRLAGMDKAGIARAVLSISGPGVQA